MNAASFIAADWPAPPGLIAGTTTRLGGASPPPRAYFDLGAGGPDAAATDDVAANRAALTAGLELPAPPVWQKQVHGAGVANIDQPVSAPADAAIATDRGRVGAVLTADCLPILLCEYDGWAWAAAHAGWRGLAAGVIEATVHAMPASPARLMAWLGPAIGPAAFEVGAEVRDVLVAREPAARHAFVVDGQRYRADIYAIARAQLAHVGVGAIYGGGFCTYTDAVDDDYAHSGGHRFYSHRRDASAGRMASVIGWRAPDADARLRRL